MKISIVTEVWVGEFDEAEFPAGSTHVTEGATVIVTSPLELGVGQRLVIEAD